jgi:hypothetical protein
MKIELGEYELIHSGLIIEIKNKPIKISIPDEIEGDFTFIINFKTDTENKEPLTNLTVINDLTLQIDFTNFNGFQGGGNSELIELGSIRKKPLFINYRVFDLSKVGKTFMFNFYVLNKPTDAK